MLTNFGVDVTIVGSSTGWCRPRTRTSPGLLKQYKKLGVTVMLSTAVQNVEDTGAGVRVTVTPAAAVTSRSSKPTSSWRVRLRAPHQATASELVRTDRGAIEVDGRCRTSVPNVYAIR